MALDRATLQFTVQNCGWVEQPSDQVEGLLAKLRFLEETGRYGPLLKQLIGANNRDNFLALLLEATFAYQFEQVHIALEYEVKQDANEKSSIDFAMKSPVGAVYFELRLLQEDKGTRDDIAAQLERNGNFAILKDGADEQKAVFKLQGVILSKVQSKEGKPTKFFKVETDAFNFVVVCISDVLLGTADAWDCLLATYGDPEVPEHCRRGVFGMFQEAKQEHPERIQETATRFAHFKATVHAVLFLFKRSSSGVLDYTLEQLLVWNRALVTKEKANPVREQVFTALKPRRARTKSTPR